MADQKVIDKVEDLKSKGVLLNGPCPKCTDGMMQPRPTTGSVTNKVVEEEKHMVIMGWECLGLECNNCGYIELYHIS